MENNKKLVAFVVLIVVSIVALGWWWGHRRTPARPAFMVQAAGAGKPLHAAAPPALRPDDAPPALRPDPASGWAIPPGTRSAVTTVAARFARALLSAPPGVASAAAVRCAPLITNSFRAWLATSPGAPVLAVAAQAVVVSDVLVTIDDWAPPGAGVAVAVSLHAGVRGPPALLTFDVHLVDGAGGWLVDGMEL